ncbi:DEKNAAC101089 [Brettanomyces naardenensis]|uniref:DEKNAAC101089 n=1 Tax=Brettanomyces naardenensis TaxID=13370 RepID=A0A448YH88_BRENA|nr:DEKNAAC101089 [Brettanomyces naardenensis]
MFASLRPLRRVPFVSSKRFASLITTPNDPKLVGLLTRLDKFDKESKIFDKLDELYLLTQRKGFFNVNANDLEFLSNNNQINNNFSNLYNFNDLNKIVANHYSNMMLLPVVTSGDGVTQTPTMIIPNAPIQGLQILTGKGFGFGRNTPVDKYLRLLNNLAKNDVELKGRIEKVLKAFDKEDDFFFNYVLEFWISGKSFNKMRAKKLQEQQEQQGGKGSLPNKIII